MNKYVIFTILILLATINGSHAQFSPTVHSISNGLPQHTITSIIKDNKGFIWVGTKHGLNRYDGLHYKTFHYTDSSGVNNSSIQCLLQDNNGDIWIGTYGGGVHIYNYKDDTFTIYKHQAGDPHSISDNHITALFQDYDGNVWIGTEKGGLNRFIPETKKFVNYLSNNIDPRSLANNTITSINQDRRGNLWIGTFGGGINLYNNTNDNFLTFNVENTATLPSNVIRFIYQSKNKGLLIGTHQGVNQLVYQNGQYFFEKITFVNDEISHKLENSRVISMCEDMNNNLWIGTENSGLFYTNSARNLLNHYPRIPVAETLSSSSSIWSLYASDDNIIWIGTFNQGLMKIDPNEQKFKYKYQQSPYPGEGLSYNLVSSFAEDSSGNIWIGTDGGGLNYYNKHNHKFTSYTTANSSLSSNAIVSLLKDKKGSLWIGTWNGGINIKKQGSDKFEQVKKDSPQGTSGKDIFKIYEDYNGYIWIASFRDGLDIYNPKTNEFHHLPDIKINPIGISDYKVRTIIQDKKGNYWIGTEGAGINKFTINASFEMVSNEYYSAGDKTNSGLPNNTITYLFEDSEGTIYAGTEGGGLYYYDERDNAFAPIKINDQLKNKVVYGILEDDHNTLWVSTNDGLVRYNRTSEMVHIFHEGDGLQSNEFYKSACYKLKNGNLLFGGINGYNEFTPSDIRLNPNRPEVVITDFQLYRQHDDQRIIPQPFNGNILNTSTISLHPDQNDFSIEFSALNFSQASKNEFEYQLVDYDKTWQKVGNRRQAYYTNVPPGDYVFKVRASNNDGLWSKESAEIKLRIDKPWYFTNWAYGIYLLIVAALLFWARQSIINKERLRAQLTMEHVELTKAQEVSQLKSRFFANISHEFRTPLTLIISPLKSMYLDETKAKYKKQIKMMISNAEKLLDLINQILDLSKLESGNMKLMSKKEDITQFVKTVAFSFSDYADKKYITFKLDTPSEPLYADVDKNKLERVLSNLISNAIKYTPEFGVITVSLSDRKSDIELTVSDTGIGMDQDEIPHIFNRFHTQHGSATSGTGIGLSLSKELIELHNGAIEVKSKEGKGSSFIISLPKQQKNIDGNEVVHSMPLRHEEHIESENKLDHEDNELLDNETPEREVPLILVVEDNDEMRDFIRDCLNNNYRINTAKHGKEGLKMAQHLIPDMIISDVMMPEVDGFELSKRLKTDIRTSHIPLILLTAKASTDSLQKGLEAGANYYITKPFNPEILQLQIKNLLDIREGFKQRILSNKNINLEPKQKIITTKDEKFIEKAVSYVEKHMENNQLQVEDLAKHLGMSKIQLYRKLKGLIGQSANEFIRTLRLKRAAQLLLEQKLTVAEITYQVGFNDLQYFRQCFKKQYGITPSSYAQRGQ